MTAIRVAHEANGLVITVEGLDGPPTTIILGGLYPGLLGLPSPDTGLATALPKRNFLALAKLAVLFILAIGGGVFLTGHRAASGTDSESSLASANHLAANMPPQSPAAAETVVNDQIPPALTAALSQPPVVIPPPASPGQPSGPGTASTTGAAPDPGALFGLQP
jgi:hypothetical protein